MNEIPLCSAGGEGDAGKHGHARRARRAREVGAVTMHASPQTCECESGLRVTCECDTVIMEVWILIMEKSTLLMKT